MVKIFLTSTNSAVEIHQSFANKSGIKFDFPSIWELRNRVLDVSSNQLSTFNMTEILNSFKSQSYKNQVTFNLFDNNFHCSCKKVDFRNFLNNKDQLNKNKEHISCIQPKTKLLASYSDKEFISSIIIRDCPNSCNCFHQCLEDLQVTNCSFRNLTDMPEMPSLVNGISSMELNIQSNRISNISFEKLPQNMTILNVQNNKISKLDQGIVKMLLKL